MCHSSGVVLRSTMGLLHSGHVCVSDLLRLPQEHRSHQQGEIHPSRPLELLWGGGKSHLILLKWGPKRNWRLGNVCSLGPTKLLTSLLEEWDESPSSTAWVSSWQNQPGSLCGCERERGCLWCVCVPGELWKLWKLISNTGGTNSGTCLMLLSSLPACVNVCFQFLCFFPSCWAEFQQANSVQKTNPYRALLYSSWTLSGTTPLRPNMSS